MLGEAVHWGRDCRGVVGTEDLFANGLEGVAGVGVDEEGVVSDGDCGGGGGGDGERVGFAAGETVDVGPGGFEPAEDVVEGAILHHYHHYGFDRPRDLVLLAEGQGRRRRYQEEEEDQQRKRDSTPERHLRLWGTENQIGKHRSNEFVCKVTYFLKSGFGVSHICMFDFHLELCHVSM